MSEIIKENWWEESRSFKKTKVEEYLNSPLGKQATIHDGDQYDFDKFEGERDRVVDFLKNRGYKAVHYLVSPDNLRAVNSYAKLGFTKAGECELYGHRWHAYEKDLYYIERSITGEFKRTLWNPFVEAIEKY